MISTSLVRLKIIVRKRMNIEKRISVKVGNGC